MEGAQERSSSLAKQRLLRRWSVLCGIGNFLYSCYVEGYWSAGTKLGDSSKVPLQLAEFGELPEYIVSIGMIFMSNVEVFLSD
jgi:hypothetical protein